MNSMSSASTANVRSANTWMAFAVRASAVVCGAAILAASASAVIEHGHQDASQARLTWSLALGVLAGSMAIGSAWASGRKALAVMLAVALLAGEAFGVLATADRIVSEREQGQAAIRTAIGAHDYAAGEAARAQNALDDANKAAVAQAALAGCKSNCRALLEAQVENAKADLNTARTRLGANPKPTAAPDALAERLGWQPWVLDLLVAGCLSLGANGLAAALIGFGAHGASVPQMTQRDQASKVQKVIDDIPAPPTSNLPAVLKVAEGEILPPDTRRGSRKKDTRLLAFVDRFRVEHGRSPSFPEFRATFPGIPRSTADRYRASGLPVAKA